MSEPFQARKSVMQVLSGLREDPHAPLSAMIEIADRCNEVCVHCYQVQGQKGELSTEHWKTILDDLAEMGVLLLTISGGEATLRHDFLDLVEYARAKRFSVKLYTNGLTMTRELAFRLHGLAVQEVQISLYSHHAHIHDWVTRVPGSWEKTVAGARFLVEAGVAVVLKAPVMTVNVDEVDRYVEFVTSLGADYQMDPHLDPREDGDTTPRRLRIEASSALGLLRNPSFARPERKAASRSLDQSVCGACSGSIHVEANGELRPCTQLPIAVGHAVEDGVAKAWRENPVGRSIRELRWADLHGCRECDLRHWCGRCFANARQEVGDALAPYPSACAHARMRYEHVWGRPPTILDEQEENAPDSVGPYAELSQGVYQCRTYELTDEDLVRVREHPWIRTQPTVRGEGPPVRPGELVQIRRPGARTERPEAVPRARIVGTD